MKRFFSIMLTLALCSAFVFADEPGDEYDDGYVYTQNGEGDQFLKIELAGFFPLNFGSQIYPGAALSIGYYRFLTENLAVGGDAIVTYSLTIGEKSLVNVPVSFGVMFQPTINKFEFPLFASIGFATVSCQGMNYFPALSLKAEVGAFYRATEAWSFGLSSNVFMISQFFADTSKNDLGVFCTANISARYHFWLYKYLIILIL